MAILQIKSEGPEEFDVVEEHDLGDAFIRFIELMPDTRVKMEVKTSNTDVESLQAVTILFIDEDKEIIARITESRYV